MRKNTNKKDYNYDKNKDIEKRVQVAQETCNSEEEIELAIERSKQKLKSNPAPNGYSKIDEEITTKIYKIPDKNYINKTEVIAEEEYNEYTDKGKNEYNNKNIYNSDYKKTSYLKNNNYHNTEYNDKNVNFKLEYISNVKPRKMQFVEDYEHNYNYNNRQPKTFIKNIPCTEGRIENYYENNISKDGQYLVTMSLSRIVNDNGPITYNKMNDNINNTITNNSKNYKEYKNEQIKINNNSSNINYNKNYNSYKKEESKVSNKDFKKAEIKAYPKKDDKINEKKGYKINEKKDYKINEKKEYSKIEYKVNEKKDTKVEDKTKNSNINKNTYIKSESKKEKFGHNYNFYERKENVNPSKIVEIHQKMRQPIQIQKKENKVETKIITSQNHNNINPSNEIKTVVKNYTKEVYGGNGNDINNNIVKSTYVKTFSSINSSKSNNKANKLNTNYQITKNH